MGSESDIKKLKQAFDAIGLPYTIRERASTSGDFYEYFFVGQPQDAKGICWPKDNFETTDLDTLLLRHKFIEFENGVLVSWYAS